MERVLDRRVAEEVFTIGVKWENFLRLERCGESFQKWKVLYDRSLPERVSHDRSEVGRIFMIRTMWSFYDKSYVERVFTIGAKLGEC